MSKLKFTIWVIVGIICCLSVSASAYTECEKKAERVWLNNDNYSVWICFTTGGCIYKLQEEVGDKIIDRTLSMGMAAIASGATLIVRYHEDNMDCDFSSGNTSEYSGFWFAG